MRARLSRLALMGCALCLTAGVLAGVAAVPPSYLAVQDFQKCLAEKDMGSYRAWCLPAEKPAACPDASWQQLRGLTGQDKVPDC